MNQQGISQKQIADTSGRSRCAVQGLLGHHQDNGDVSYLPSFCWPRCTTFTGRQVWQLVRHCLGHRTSFFTSWSFFYFLTHFCVFDLWYTFWRHDEFLWCHDALFDFVMNFLMSWRTIWRHDVFLASWQTFWHHAMFLTSGSTFWRHDVFGVLFDLTTSWRFLWCHDALFDFVMNFLVSWRTIWRHDVFLTSWQTCWHHVVLLTSWEYFLTSWWVWRTFLLDKVLLSYFLIL